MTSVGYTAAGFDNIYYANLLSPHAYSLPGSFNDSVSLERFETSGPSRAVS